MPAGGLQLLEGLCELGGRLFLVCDVARAGRQERGVGLRHLRQVEGSAGTAQRGKFADDGIGLRCRHPAAGQEVCCRSQLRIGVQLLRRDYGDRLALSQGP